MWKNVLVLVSLCLLFEDVNAQTTKNRYYKANDENVSYVGRTEIQSDGSVSFDWTGTYLRTRLSGGELSMKISDTGINYYNVFVDSLLHKTVPSVFLPVRSRTLPGRISTGVNGM